MATPSRPPPAQAHAGEDAKQVFRHITRKERDQPKSKALHLNRRSDAIIDNVGRGKQELEDPLGQADEFRGCRGRGLDRCKEARYEGSEISEAVGSRPKHDDGYGERNNVLLKGQVSIHRYEYVELR
jgi:hypothetical protein